MQNKLTKITPGIVPNKKVGDGLIRKNHLQISPDGKNWLVESPEPVQTSINNNMYRQSKDQITIYNLEKNLNYAKIQHAQINQMARWKEADVKGSRKALYLKMVTSRNDAILNVVAQTEMEQLENYRDSFPCLECRKYLLRFRIKVNQFAVAVISHKIFEYGTITVILLNSLQMSFEDPKLKQQPLFFQRNEDIFLVAYTFEMLAKMIAMGLILDKNAYLRDAWGLLDFIIVMSAYFTKWVERSLEPTTVATQYDDPSGINLNALRAFRVLRPLRTITTIKGLRVLVQSILSALPMMKQTVIVLLFFFLVFSIAGVQLLQGVLLQRCITIQTGQLYLQDDDSSLHCGGRESCPDPEKQFCGKTNQNPNYGVTNLDNVFYGLFMVFQCTTLEGWTEIQTMYQKTLSMYIAVFFIAMVFIGAFFLINLTLAVINASFTKSQLANKDAEKAALDHLLGKDSNQENFNEDFDMKAQIQEGGKKEIGVTEFFIAKRAARKMIDFVARRRITRQKEEEKLKTVQEFTQIQSTDAALMISTVPNMESLDQYIPQTPLLLHEKSNDTSIINTSQSKLLQTLSPRKIEKSQNVQRVVHRPPIIEEEGEEDRFHVDQYNEEVKKFLIEASKVYAEDNTQINKNNYRSQEKLNVNLNPEPFSRKKQKHQSSHRLLPSHNNQLSRDSQPAQTSFDNKNQSAVSFVSENSKIHEDLAFDKIIKLEAKVHPYKEKKEPAEEEHPFDLSFVESVEHLEQNSIIFGSEELDKSKLQSNQEIHSIIDSDSLQDQLENMKRQKAEEDQMHKQQSKKLKEPNLESIGRSTSHIFNLKQRIRRANTTMDYLDDQSIEHDNQQSMSTLPLKLEDDRTEAGVATVIQFKGSEHKSNKDLENSIIVQKKQAAAKAKQSLMKQQVKKLTDLKGIDDQFLKSNNKPRDPYEFIDKKVQKIEINHGVAYGSTSQDDIFEPRIHMKKAAELIKRNKFITKPIDPENVVEDEAAFIKQTYMPKCRPFESKSQYKVQVNEQELTDSEEEDEDYLAEMVQPYETVMNIGYNQQLTHLSTKFLFRRSDILVSSTLSITLSPIMHGEQRRHLALMNDEQIEQWVDLRHEYKSTDVKNHKMPQVGYFPGYYKNPMWVTFKRQKEKQLQSSDSPVKIPKIQNIEQELPNENQLEDTIIAEAEYKFGLEGKPKQTKLIPGCLLRDPLTPEEQYLLGPDERRLYNFQKNKFDGTIRILKSFKEPLWEKNITLKDARDLKAGRFQHYGDAEEDDVDEDAIFEKIRNQHVRQEEGIVLNLDNFEHLALAKHKKQEDITFQLLNEGDEIPQELRDELDLPSSLFMNRHEVDFSEVREKDCNLKRRTQFWSGQDVLQDSLTDAHSEWVVTYLNAVRVWPKNLYGYIKKIRITLKMLVRSGPFDNAMLISVLLNTVVMSMDRFDLEPEPKKVLEDMNTFFTWIFIIEMSLKLMAIGAKKYTVEVMNILDGSVVMLSIMEMSIAASSQGGDTGESESQGSLQAFRSIRIFRTFRVLRVVRILRVLSSMQMIVGVLQRSISSFTYIAMLLMVCCFIFALLGKTLFGGKFINADGTIPRGNFDTFNLAFITVFQVLTMENWQTVAFDSMKGQMGMWGPAIFYIVWIFLGNFILLNLFLAILLDSFIEEDEEESSELNEEMQEAKKKLKQRQREIKEKEKIRKLKKLGQSALQSFNKQIIRQQQKKKKRGFRMLTQMGHGANQEDQFVDNIEDLDEKTIRDMFMDQGLLKDHKNERKKAKMYMGVACFNSFYVFNKGNQFRDLCFNLQSNKSFDNGVMLLIGLNSAKLAIDTYFDENDEGTIVRIFKIIDYFFNFCFALEALIKSIALGFIQDEGSFLRESWNQLDFFIVITSFVDMGMSITNADTEVGALKIIRLLRILRPLRVVSHNQAMKMIVTALFESVGAILNVLIVVLMVWLMFAILQINLLSGCSFYCSIGMYSYHRKEACNAAGGSWLKYDSNYDDIGQAMMTLFIVATLEGWPDIMLQSVDSTKAEQGPAFEQNRSYVYFYVIFILLGSFFLLNFFIGVLFLKYTQAQREEQRGYSEPQLLWKELTRMIPQAKVAHDQLNRPKVWWRKAIWRLVNTTQFDFAIMGFIVLNMIQMSLTHEGATSNFEMGLRMANYIFTVVFLIEMILKLLAYECSYFQTDWNKFDFGVVIASLFDIALEILSSQQSSGQKSLLESLQLGSIAKVLRVFRISRVLRLVNRSKEMQALMQTITMSVGALLSVFGLLLLILFMFSVLGVNFFQTITEGEVIDFRYKNFKDFMLAYILLFGISTGEDWNKVMYDTIDTPPNCIARKTCGTSYTPFYFILFIMVITQIMLNLFILVIIQQFDIYYVKDDNPIKTFSSSYDKFHSVWIILTQNQNCVRINQRYLQQFFKEMQQPIGFKTSAGLPEINDGELTKKILSMGIKVDEGWIYFNELLYRCMKRVYADFKLSKKMQLLELNTQFKIFLLTVKTKESLPEFHGKSQQNNEEVFKRIIERGTSVNPFLTMMYYRISFFTWLNAYRKDQESKVGFTLDTRRPRVKTVKYAEGWEAKEVEIEVEEIIEYTSEEDVGMEEEESDDMFQDQDGMGGDSPLVRYKTNEKAKKPTRKSSGGKVNAAGLNKRLSQSVMVVKRRRTIDGIVDRRKSFLNSPF